MNFSNYDILEWQKMVIVIVKVMIIVKYSNGKTMTVMVIKAIVMAKWKESNDASDNNTLQRQQ